MSTMEQKLSTANNSAEGSDEVPPSGPRRRGSGEPPPPLSRFALRDDGILLLSIEDASDRDLDGRALQTFLILTEAEVVEARQTADDGISAAAAKLIARLPKK